jgi:hypothetical protein
MAEPIRFIAVVQKVQTLVDGGLRFTFDAPETEVMAAAELMECKRVGMVLGVIVESQVSDERQGSIVSRTKAKRRIA